MNYVKLAAITLLLAVAPSVKANYITESAAWTKMTDLFDWAKKRQTKTVVACEIAAGTAIAYGVFKASPTVNKHVKAVGTAGANGCKTLAKDKKKLGIAAGTLAAAAGLGYFAWKYGRSYFSGNSTERSPFAA